MTAALTIDIHELTNLGKTVAGAQPVVNRNLNKAGRQAGFAVESQAKAEAPVKTGTLKAHIGPPKIDQRGVNITVEVKSHAAYSVPVHEGRGEVVPVNKKVLRWEGPGGVVFSMRSKATKPNRYMDRGLAKAEPTITQAFDAALTNAMRELGF